MKFHLALKTTGRWIGGCDYHADQRAQMVTDLTPVATSWGDIIVATRVDRRGGKRGETILINPDTK